MILFLDATDPGRSDTLLTLLGAHWPIWLTASLGALGIYGLLPRGRATNAVWGGLAVAAALLAAGRWLSRHDGVWPERWLFGAFAFLAIGGGILMLAQKNPVHAALSFALVVLSTCGLFLLLAAPFLMAATIIIYAGAIVVTFLFVIMLAQQEGATSADARSREPFLASLAGFVLLGALGCVIDKTYNAAPLLAELDALAQVTSWDQVARRWGDPKEQGDSRTMPAVQQWRQALPKELHDAVFGLESAWSRKDHAALAKLAGQLRDRLRQAQARAGTMTAPAEPHAPPEPPLTAQNVAGLGQALFTRYLVPVELAAVLLLVATIGAIVIAGPRPAPRDEAAAALNGASNPEGRP